MDPLEEFVLGWIVVYSKGFFQLNVAVQAPREACCEGMRILFSCSIYVTGGLR